MQAVRAILSDGLYVSCSLQLIEMAAQATKYLDVVMGVRM